MKPGRVGAELLIGPQVTTAGIEHRPGIRVYDSVGDVDYRVDYVSVIVTAPQGFC